VPAPRGTNQNRCKNRQNPAEIGALKEPEDGDGTLDWSIRRLSLYHSRPKVFEKIDGRLAGAASAGEAADHLEELPFPCVDRRAAGSTRAGTRRPRISTASAVPSAAAGAATCARPM
jgi:hypothetical protein